MLSVVSVTEKRSCQVLLQRPPKGTPSRVLSLRLQRCFHRQKVYGPPSAHISSLYRPKAICRNGIKHPNIDSSANLRCATTYSAPSPISQDALSLVQSLLNHSNTNTPRGVKPLGHHRTSNIRASNGVGSQPISPDGAAPTPPDPSHELEEDPFRCALSAMREGDTRKLLRRLNNIECMSREDLQDAVTTLPRTTFTEFFRALDPLCVARDCDPAGVSHIPVGMFKMLHMESSMDDWGVRKLYTRLLQRLLVLMDALKTSGRALHAEEYISLLRCAGAASDIIGVKRIWRDLILGPAVAWRNSEVYTEFIKARFLTDPLYTNYRKITRMVTPRNLHRSRMRLIEGRVRRLDTLRLMIRWKKLRFGLNKEADHVEELMRLLRGNGPALSLFRRVILHGYRLDENLLCAIMIALGRSGTLRFIGTHILQKQFGITMSHLTLDERDSQSQATAQRNKISSGPSRIRPTVCLMRAVVETYGSNGEISIAVQLVEHLSNTHGIPIPLDVWQDLMEWTYIMTTPPATTAWKMAGLYAKIPSPKAVDMIWNAMISPPYNQIPSFEHYDVLIRSLIGQRSFDQAQALSRIREAVVLYHDQCQEYEAAVFEYIQLLRNGISSGVTVHRFECARFKKQQMWYNISVWCRTLFKDLRYSLVSPVPNPLVPGFIKEFRPFLKNPIQYKTPTGHVSLVDPAIETFRSVQTGVLELTFRMKDKKGTWAHLRRHQQKVAVLSSHSLADFKPTKLTNPLDLLAPQQDAHQPVHQRPMSS